MAALNEYMQCLSWMFLKDFCKEGRCAESRPIAIYVVHSTCARLLAGIFKYSELTLQSRFFSQSLERAVKEKLVDRAPIHVQNPGLVQNLEGKDRAPAGNFFF